MTKIPHMVEKWHQFQNLVHRIFGQTLVIVILTDLIFVLVPRTPQPKKDFLTHDVSSTLAVVWPQTKNWTHTETCTC